MPTIVVPRDVLFHQIGKDFKSVEEFEDLCFDFGIEYDGTETDPASGKELYRIELPANRTDLLSVEGLGHALRVFLGNDTIKETRLSKEEPTEKLIVEASAARIRPYCFAAILRGVTFTPENFKSFIDLQDKLHHNIARRRQLVSMGTHDYGTIKGPIYYRAEEPEKIRFVPLTQKDEMDGYQMMDWLSKHPQLRAYTHIVESSPVWPVVRDSRGIVCSVPPLINSEHSKVTLDTKDVFIEITATDRTKCSIVTNILVSLFSQYCSQPYTVEPVLVQYATGHSLLGGKSFRCPNLSDYTLETTVDYIVKHTGIPDIGAPEICRLLRRMGIDATASKDNKCIVARAPTTRPDVFHPCDLAEDVAIAYGFNKISVRVMDSAKEQDYMVLSQQVRLLISQCGFHEVLNWGLCSYKEAFALLKRTESKESSTKTDYMPNGAVIRIANPKTKEFEIVRPTLIAGLLKSLASNRAQELPIRLFELGEVCRLDESTETRTTSVRHFAALTANSSGSDLEVLHGVVDELLFELGLVAEYEEHENRLSKAKGRNVYCLKQNDKDGLFFPGRSISIIVDDNTVIGGMGIVHPHVLKNYGIPFPVSCVEITLEPFLSNF